MISTQSAIFRWFFLIVLVWLGQCAPIKPDVTEQDVQRILERLAQQRVATGLNVKKGQNLPSDFELVEESCRIFRLDCAKVQGFLREDQPAIYREIWGQP